MIEVFQRYGLPARINVDNGPPWGSPRNPGEVTELSIWLIRLGIRISFRSYGHFWCTGGGMKRVAYPAD